MVTRNPQFPLEPDWQVATSPQQALAILAAASQAQALLGGGLSLNTAFAQAGLINQVVIYMESVIVGRGLPIFAPQDFELRLHLLEVKQAPDEVVQLRYQVRAES